MRNVEPTWLVSVAAALELPGALVFVLGPVGLALVLGAIAREVAHRRAEREQLRREELARAAERMNGEQRG